jgi:phosphatidylserine/phosphatidylglycerophosphate/cardiolipin synthase-like enzyme
MPDIDTLKARYFADATDATLPSEPVPQQFDGCKITPLIDASNYNAALLAALATVGTGPDPASNSGHFILIQNWWLGLSGGSFTGMSGLAGSNGPEVKNYDPYYLDGVPTGGPTSTGGMIPLIDVLSTKARVGVEVRILGWLSFGAMGSSIYNYIADTIAGVAPSLSIPYRSVNAATMKAVSDLRKDDTLRPYMQAILNVIGHTAGGIHSKLVVIGNNTRAVGFTGGLDFSNNRWAHPGHPGKEFWHDAVAQVEGPAVQALYDWFQDMWQENLKRPVKRFKLDSKELPSFLPRTPALPARTLPTTPLPENHSVQSLRTVSAFNYKWYNCLPENPPCSFASKGIFEVRIAMRKALRNAQTYVYMEDQSFWAQEVLGWVNEAIKARPDLRVILVTNGRTDPLDPEFPAGTLATAFNRGLLAGLTPAQVAQVGFFKRLGPDKPVVDKNNNPVGVNVTASTAQGDLCLLTTDEIATHAVVADMLAGAGLEIHVGGNVHRIIGNEAAQPGTPVVLRVDPIGAACLGPGAYPLHIRGGVVIHTKSTLVDDAWAIIGSANIMRRSMYTDFEHSVGFIDPAGVAVRDYRAALWCDHFGHNTPADFHDIPGGLHAWRTDWGTAGSAPPRPPGLAPIPLPITPDATRTDKQQAKYDDYEDLDSRQEWGGLCP